MTRLYLLAAIAALIVALALACGGTSNSPPDNGVPACFGMIGCGNPIGDDDTAFGDDDTTDDDDNDDASPAAVLTAALGVSG